MKRLALGLILTVLGLGSAGSARAQMAYTRSSFSGNYVAISTATGASTISFANLDDGATSIALPFNFTYAGTGYTTSNFLAVVTNGHAFFSLTSVTAPISSNNVQLFTTTTPNLTLAPWWDDLSTAAVGTNPAGSVLYQTQGIVGSRTLTVQWTNVSAYSSAGSGQPRGLNFQIVLYEGTNRIEFHYGPTIGAGSSSLESASIGIEDGTGGDGHYLDGMTGSSRVNNGMMTSQKWPTRFLRFDPGAPAALAAGEYTIGVGETYETPTDAIADLNQRGVAGEIVFTLTDAEYPAPATTYPLLLGPVTGTSAINTVSFMGSATLRAEGASAGTCGNTTLTGAIGTSNEPILGLIGSDYITVKGLQFETLGSGQVDRGILVANNSGLDGASHNTLTSLSIALYRGNSNSIGIQQATIVNPSLFSGTNSYNAYTDLAISNVTGGVHLVGNATLPDANCEVGASAPGGTIIGAAAANDIGNGTAQVTGIRAYAQSGVRIYHCEIQNLTGVGTASVEGIHLDNLGTGLVGVGTCEISNNTIHGLKNTNTSAGVVRGIRANLTNNVGSVTRIYNNLVYDLSSSSLITSSRRVVGISLQDVASGNAATHQVDFNSVRLSPAGLLCSNSCLELGTVTGSKMIIRNNILANFTASQSGQAKHYAFVTPGATSIGPVGSLSDRNDLYVNSPVNGHVGLAAGSDKSTLADWQGVVAGVDANSRAGNPQFTSATDLHIAPLAPTPVEGAGSLFAGAITWAGADIDGDTRDSATPDIGADEGAFTTLAGDDVAAVGIEEPTDVEVKVAGTPFTPRASFQNVGMNPQTAVPVRFRISGPAPDTSEVYNQTTTTPPLGVAGPPVVISFPAATVVAPGSYSITVTSELPSDAIVVNDQISGSFTVVGPLAGTYHVGVAQAPPFHSLTAAIERLNLVGVGAPVTFLLDDTAYQSPGETFPLVIQQYNGSGADNPVVIAPAPGVNPTITGAVSGAVMRLNGADYVTIDGSNNGTTSRNLTVVNTSTAALTAAVWLSSAGAGAGASHNTIRNCVLRCGVDQRSSANETFGILSSGATLSGSSDGADNDANTFQNNAITAVRWGVYLRGAALNPNDDCVVSENLVGPAGFGVGQIGRGGIVLQHQNGTLVSRNEIRSVGVLITDTAPASDRIGIGLGDSGWLPASLVATNIQVVGNRVHDIVEEKRFSAVGIVVAGDGAPSANRVANNMVYGVRSNGTSNDQAVGIGISGGRGDQVVFNSISLGGDLDPGAALSAATSGCGVRISGTAPVDLTLKNNIVSVDYSSNTGTLRHFGVVAPSAAFDWGNGGSDNNDYHVNGANPQMVLGGIGTTIPYTEVGSLAGWRAQFTPNQDSASVAADPRFTSATDLHINAVGPVVSPVSRAGVAIGGITQDFDGEAGLRAVTPDIGADEFPTAFLATGSIGNGSVAAVPAGPEFNIGQQATLTATPNDSCTVFVGWSGDASGTANPLVVTLSGDRTIAAQFGPRLVAVLAAAGPGGTIAPSGAVNVACGGDTTFTIVPDSCHVIADVLVDGISVGAQASVTLTNVTSARTISASFARRSYTVTTSAGPDGGIVPAGIDTVLCGDSLLVTVTPDSCHRIDQLLVDGAPVAAPPSGPTTVAFNGVSANHTVSATFVLRAFPIVATAGAGGTIIPADTLLASCGSNRLVTIVPDSCHVIADVLVDSVSVGAVSSYTFVDVQAAHTISALFARRQFAVLASAGPGGTIAPSGAVNVACGGDTTFAIVPDSCHVIADVLVDGISVGAQASVTLTNVTAARTVSASFARRSYTVTTSAGPDGGIVPAGIDTVLCGDSLLVTVTPDSCHRIDQLLVDGAPVAPPPSGPTTVAFNDVSANHTVNATFVLRAFPIVATAGAGGTIIPADTLLVSCGSNRLVTIVPDSCHVIADVLVDSVSVGAVSSYTFVDVQTAHTISAVFARRQFAVLATAGPGGTIAPSGAVNVACGGDTTFAIVPDSCHVIADVLVDGISVGAQASVTLTNVTSARTVSASFARRSYTVTTSAGPDGNIVPAGIDTVLCGDSLLVTVTPDSCHRIDQLLVDGAPVAVPPSGPTTVAFNGVSANHTVNATFVLRAFPIVATAGAGGTIIPADTLLASCGSNRLVTIVPDSCHVIADVLVDSVSVGAVSSYTFVDVQAAHTISAVFARRQFAVLAAAGPGGTIAPSGAVNVACGGDTTFTIVPDSCHVIADVLVDGISVGAQASVTLTNVTSARTVSASFARRSYTVTTSAGPDGNIVPAGIDTVLCGDSLLVTVTPDSCRRIDQLLVDGAPVAAPPSGPTTVAFNGVSANHTVSATFVLRAFPIVATAGAGGTIIPADTLLASCGSNRLVTIVPDSCHVIADVLVDSVSVGAVSSYTFVDVQTAHTISAVFQPILYQIMGSTDGWARLVPELPLSVACGTTQHFVVEVDSCHVVYEVVIDKVSLGAVTSFDVGPIHEDHSIEVYTNPAAPTIDATAGAGGTIVPAGIVPVECGAGITFTVTPDSCFEVADVLVDGLSIGPVASHEFTAVRASHTIQATFRRRTFTITAAAGPGGEITPEGAVVVACGGDTTFAITPDPGFALLDLLIDAIPVSPVNSYTFSGVTASHTITATFVDVLAPTVQVVSPNGGESWGVGSPQVITWNAADNGSAATITLEYSTDAGASWLPIAAGLGNSGSHPWIVPATPTAQALVRATAVDAALLAAADTSDAVFVISDQSGAHFLPAVLTRPMVLQNRPNPFNPTTRIGFGLPTATRVRLVLYTIDGRLVRTLADGDFPAGYTELSWDGRADGGASLPSGVYFYRFEAGSVVETRRLVMSK